MSDTIIIPFFPSDTLLLICPFLSFIACLAALIASLSLRLYKDSMGVMSLYIIIADLCFEFPKLIACFGYEKSFHFCNIMLAFSHFGMVSSFFWAAFFAHLLFRVAKTHNVHVSKKYMTLYVVCAVVLPILHTIASMFTDYVEYNPTTRSCIHTMTVGQVDYGYVFYTQLPLVMAILMSLYWYVGTILQLRHVFEKGHDFDLLTLILYPAILIICWTPATIASTMAFFGIRPNPSLVAVFQGLVQLQGFFDALVYGRSKSLFRFIWLCCRKRRSIDQRISQSSEQDSIDTEEALRLSLMRREIRKIDTRSTTEMY